MALPYRILERKRAGMRLDPEEIGSVARGATDGSWSDGQLAAFLMAAAIRGLDPEETRALTLAMRDSGERWDLGAAVPGLCDKHSTGGVGDKVSLVIAPLLASCGLPVFMLAGRGLGHTGGTIDKLESVPGLDLGLDRARCLDLLGRCRMAIGGATAGIAPADRRLYALRDVTATVDSIPLIIASILSKKLATGPAAVVFDVKTGNGAFLPELDRTLELARGLAARPAIRYRSRRAPAARAAERDAGGGGRAPARPPPRGGRRRPRPSGRRDRLRDLSGDPGPSGPGGGGGGGAGPGLPAAGGRAPGGGLRG